ncbi:MAG: GNAT family N-acetyltransferase [Theionarchaea archaeon]|nr:GNAT family N-acetyltransferase [Theionarchaea archaeon]
MVFDRKFEQITDRLLIRPLTTWDAEELHEILGDPVVMARIPSGASGSLDETKKRLTKIIESYELHGYGLWAVLRRDNGRLIGECGIIPVEGKGPEVEIAYQFSRSSWGRGYATESAKECLRYGLDELGMDRIIGITYPDHGASRRVMEKAGMSYVGTGFYYRHEMVVYEILRNP